MVTKNLYAPAVCCSAWFGVFSIPDGDDDLGVIQATPIRRLMDSLNADHRMCGQPSVDSGLELVQPCPALLERAIHDEKLDLHANLAAPPPNDTAQQRPPPE